MEGSGRFRHSLHVAMQSGLYLLPALWPDQRKQQVFYLPLATDRLPLFSGVWRTVSEDSQVKFSEVSHQQNLLLTTEN